jgi:hypothetical protein
VSLSPGDHIWNLDTNKAQFWDGALWIDAGGGGGGGYSPSPRYLIVDANVGSGDYTTIQAAVNAAEIMVPPPAPNDPIVIFVHPKNAGWNENVVIRQTGIRLIGVGGQGTTKIIAQTGTPLTLTNATLASLAAFDISGNYADLVNQGNAGPTDIQIRDIELESKQAGKHAMRCLGVKGDSSPTTTRFLNAELLMINVTFKTAGGAGKGLWVRNANYISTGGYFWNPAGAEFHNISGFWPTGGETDGDIIIEYNLTSPFGRANGAHLGFNGIYHIIRGSLILQGTGKVGGDTCTSCSIESNLDVQNGNPTRGVLDNPYIKGNIIIANGATLIMNAGRYMGTLTDPGGGFTRNLGS